MNYLSRHWHGRHSLPRAFWINTVALWLVLRFALDQGPGLVGLSGKPLPTAVLVALSVIFGAILVWQAVGVVRSSSAHVRRYGSPFDRWGAVGGVIIVVLLTAITLFDFAGAGRVFTAQPRGLDGDPGFTIELSPDRRSVRLGGNIDYEMIGELIRILDDNSGVDSLELGSDGGLVFAARGLARVIVDRGMDTVALDRCYSACMLVYMGGATRRAGAGARLGFHQYHMDANYRSPWFDIREEERKDRSWYLSRGVSTRFVQRIFDEPHDGIWIPDMAELTENGVVHEIL